MSAFHFHEPKPPTTATPRLMAARIDVAQARLERWHELERAGAVDRFASLHGP